MLHNSLTVIVYVSVWQTLMRYLSCVCGSASDVSISCLSVVRVSVCLCVFRAGL